MRTSTVSLIPVLVSHGVSTDERLRRLEVLDLTNIRRKLMEPSPEGQGWSEAQALEAEKWYKRYLATIIKYPDATQHVPNGPIDMFWHQHILDTMAYAKDCAHVLGYFLHHYPYFGLNGDAAERDSSFDETNEIYTLMFGEDCKHMQHFAGKLKVKDCEGSDCARTSDGDSPKDCTSRRSQVSSGVNCNSGGSGTGCGQGCSRGSKKPELALATGSNCNSGGSGTGCGQGCSRGRRADFGPPMTHN